MSLKSIVKAKLSQEIWADLRSQKRYIKTLFQKSCFAPSLKEQKKILIIGVADYKNLGDHAIAQAQYTFLKSVIGNERYIIVEIPSRTPLRHIEKIVNDEDVMLFTGGGNLGTKYGFLHDIYLPLLAKYPNQKKLFFPQSYTFNENGDSEKLIKRIKTIFESNGKNLTITARESKSYNLFKKTFPENNVIKSPDIVLSLENRKRSERQGILMLMRDAGEKVLSFEKQDEIIEILKGAYTVTVHENDNAYDVAPKDRLRELETKWEEIRKSSLVITDRLHGMIFAQTTGTPCIVFDNYNSKIKMTYEDWLENMPHVVFIDPRNGIDVIQFTKIVEKLIGKSVQTFDVKEKYNELTAALKKIVK